ncbi:dTDP-4-dehydrorhamnose reductase [Brevibacillus brevis]|uniref:dTDP-4-dehydrorhamnose reductase n=1 Tax=Brevibacillus brevis TaxID=1393 RepID=A0A2Z4MPT2_BREBE|nr:dTDP-4-dehydrorhamnose reductase [Brevibacillus brevis]AWX58567.1 dTDP-4-dehydrorhamnose reductase [Brevibacillus brevis]
MKVLITGGKGQLGVDVTSIFQQKGHEVWSYGKDELDITSIQQLKQIVGRIRPDLIVHTAAYTKVDQAEADRETAFRINALGTRNVAVMADQVNAKLIYISTDYVFDGRQNHPYDEFSPVNPQTVYGKSKLAGEEFVQQLCKRYFIVRTSWVYGQAGANFVKTMLQLASKQSELTVVHDQFGCPTYTVDLAAFLTKLAETELYGVYHASNRDKCSWYEFATAIFEETGREDVRITPVTTEQFKRPAPRPAYSVFDHMAIRLNGFEPLRPWREALREFLKEWNKKG